MILARVDLLLQMQLPISRSRLQNYRKGEAYAVEKGTRIEDSLKNIYKAIENIILTTDNRKYIHKITVFEKYGRPQYFTGVISLGSIVDELMEGLKEMFPDSKIILDQSASNITIDWS